MAGRTCSAARAGGGGGGCERTRCARPFSPPSPPSAAPSPRPALPVVLRLEQLAGVVGGQLARSSPALGAAVDERPAFGASGARPGAPPVRSRPFFFFFFFSIASRSDRVGLRPHYQTATANGLASGRALTGRSEGADPLIPLGVLVVSKGIGRGAPTGRPDLRSLISRSHRSTDTGAEGRLTLARLTDGPGD